MLVRDLLRERLSPEQISGRLRRDRLLYVSHETIYRYIWADKRAGGHLYEDLRQRTRKRRKRYGTTERRGRVSTKRHISERPESVEGRQEPGHWEIDTVHSTVRDSIVTLVERASGVTLIGKLANLTAAELNHRVILLIRNFERCHGHSFLTITADNGTEFHSYERLERATGVKVYFATPYHSWERGTNENTNGLIRQYLPKRTSMEDLTQVGCNRISRALNTRPRKRYGFATPFERLEELQRNRDTVTNSVAA